MTFKEPGNNEDIMDEQTLDLSEVLMTTFQTFKRSGGERHEKHIIHSLFLPGLQKKKNMQPDRLQNIIFIEPLNFAKFFHIHI